MRSKTLLAANILAALYSAGLLWVFGGALIAAGGLDIAYAMAEYFDLIFSLIGTSSAAMNAMYIIFALLLAHVILFTLGALIGWISYLAKKSGGAKFAATLYLLGTICFPVYLLFGLPITIVGFIGGGKQKKINQTVKAAEQNEPTQSY